jgi:DNA-binding Lrp family transcriptional regulator
MSDGVCSASHSTIAKILGLRRETVLAHLKILLESGYLQSVGTETGETCIYQDTGKANMRGVISAEEGDVSLANRGVSLANRGCELNSQGGVSLANTNKTLLIDNIIEEVSSDEDTHPSRNEREKDSLLSLPEMQSADSTPRTDSTQETAKGNGRLPKVAPPPALPLTEGQRLFLEAFDAKRFGKSIQRETVAELEQRFGIEKLREYVKWAAKRGLNMGAAVIGAEKALTKWGKPVVDTKRTNTRSIEGL